MRGGVEARALRMAVESSIFKPHVPQGASPQAGKCPPPESATHSQLPPSTDFTGASIGITNADFKFVLEHGNLSFLAQPQSLMATRNQGPAESLPVGQSQFLVLIPEDSPPGSLRLGGGR